MAQVETLQVKKRDSRGKRHARRLRREGEVPAILYGHGEASVALSVPASQLDMAVRHGAHLVNLQGDVAEQAIIRELQWDTYSKHILHVDFTRVSQHELVEVVVPIELVGEAPGAREGGVLEHVAHEVTIECPASAIPEKLVVGVNDLHLNQALTLADLKLPQGARLVGNADAVVVQCREPVEVSEEITPEVAEGAEPEMIGRKAEEASDEEEKG